MTKINTHSFTPLNSSQRKQQQNYINAAYVRLRYSVCSSKHFQEYNRLIKKVPDWKEIERTSGKAECQRLITVMESLGLEEIKTQFLASKNRVFIPISDGQKVIQVASDKKDSLLKLAEHLSRVLLIERRIAIDPSRIAFFRNGEELKKQNLKVKELRFNPEEGLQAGATLNIRTLTGRSFRLTLPFHMSYGDFDAEVCKVDAEVCKEKNLEKEMLGMSRYYCNGEGLDEEQPLAVDAALWSDRSTPITRVLKLRGD